MAHPWSLSPNAAEPPASARSLHPLLFPPHGKCICCDAEGDLVVRLLGGKRSHAHGTYFTLLDGHGRAASSFYKERDTWNMQRERPRQESRGRGERERERERPDYKFKNFTVHSEVSTQHSALNNNNPQVTPAPAPALLANSALALESLIRRKEKRHTHPGSDQWI